MTTKIVLLIAAAIVWGGCQNSPTTSRPGPYVRPGLVMIPADQAHLYGVPLGSCASRNDQATEPYAATDVRSVQSESAVTALQFNRYADPSRPNQLMHEAHIVYRRENSPRWRLQPSSAQQQILVGPRVTDGRGEVQPLASQELETYLREQRASLQKQQQVMGQVTEGMKQLSEQQQQLARELAKINAERSSSASLESRANEAARSQIEPTPSAEASTPKSE